MALDAMYSLPNRQLEMLYLFAVEGLSVSEISDILEIRPATAKANLCHARNAMRRRLPKLWTNKRQPGDKIPDMRPVSQEYSQHASRNLRFPWTIICAKSWPRSNESNLDHIWKDVRPADSRCVVRSACVKLCVGLFTRLMDNRLRIICGRRLRDIPATDFRYLFRSRTTSGDDYNWVCSRAAVAGGAGHQEHRRADVTGSTGRYQVSLAARGKDSRAG